MNCDLIINKVCLQYNLSPVMLGVVFLAATGVYGFSAPAWGHVADKKVRLFIPVFLVGVVLFN